MCVFRVEQGPVFGLLWKNRYYSKRSKPLYWKTDKVDYWLQRFQPYNNCFQYDHFCKSFLSLGLHHNTICNGSAGGPPSTSEWRRNLVQWWNFMCCSETISSILICANCFSVPIWSIASSLSLDSWCKFPFLTHFPSPFCTHFRLNQSVRSPLCHIAPIFSQHHQYQHQRRHLSATNYLSYGCHDNCCYGSGSWWPIFPFTTHLTARSWTYCLKGTNRSG